MYADLGLGSESFGQGLLYPVGYVVGLDYRHVRVYQDMTLDNRGHAAFHGLEFMYILHPFHGPGYPHDLILVLLRQRGAEQLPEYRKTYPQGDYDDGDANAS